MDLVGWSLKKEMPRGIEHRLEKVPLKGIIPQKLHWQTRRTHERPKVPTELSTEEKIPRQPAEKDLPRDGGAATQSPQ
jgi:hypothetical protein